MLRWSRKRKGFTLVELVIVIAILGILAMYALPKYQGIVEEARSSEARAQLGSVRSALGIYYAKNHGVYPAELYKTIFANDEVPEVEYTVSDNGGHKVVRGNKVENFTDDGNAKDNVDNSTTGSNGPGWVYDVNSDRDTADVRINSTDVDPADSNTATPKKKWYDY